MKISEARKIKPGDNVLITSDQWHGVMTVTAIIRHCVDDVTFDVTTSNSLRGILSIFDSKSLDPTTGKHCKESAKIYQAYEKSEFDMYACVFSENAERIT